MNHQDLEHLKALTHAATRDSTDVASALRILGGVIEMVLTEIQRIKAGVA